MLHSLIYLGVNRVDYDFAAYGGVFTSHIESCHSPKVTQWLPRWLRKVLHLILVKLRPDAYNPLGIENPSPKWLAKLG